ncbi:MAG: hypothetical protein Q8Q16_07330 [Betaproteobacteria bacterium]|nr:hypothetical protein [Betaproteobacteria bacterium]
MARSIDAPVPTFEEAQAHRYSEPERTDVEQQRARLVHGDPAENTSSSTDVYETFRRMLARGEVPDGIDHLLRESRKSS